jgi:hypothetical protein
MPLKGVLLVALGIRRAAERPMIDVDVLVEPRVAHAVVAAARARGWQTPSGTDSACVLIHPKTSSTSIDLHRTLFRPHIFRMDTEGVFARSETDTKLFGRPIQRMHALDLYAHLVGHFVKGRSDSRDLRHLRDFAAVGRWSRAAASDVAVHLERVGMARAARYALRLAAENEGDTLASEILRALPRDPMGRLLARATRLVLNRVELGSRWGVPFVHALNASLPRGARTFVEHVTQPEGDDRSRDGWWRP